MYVCVCDHVILAVCVCVCFGDSDLKTPSGHSMFTSCVSELVLETREVRDQFVLCSCASCEFRLSA